MCGSAARTDLYGGQLAIAVPTVTELTPIVLLCRIRWNLRNQGQPKKPRLPIATPHTLSFLNLSHIKVSWRLRGWELVRGMQDRGLVVRRDGYFGKTEVATNLSRVHSLSLMGRKWARPSGMVFYFR